MCKLNMCFYTHLGEIMLTIKQLTPEIVDDKLKAMWDEIPAIDEYEQTNDYNDKSIQNLKEMVKDSLNQKVDLAKDEVPNKTYILYDDDYPIGMGGIRTQLTDFWLKHGGHLWYKIRPSQRRKGYATKLTAMLIEKLNEQGITTIYAQCNVKNIGSSKVLINNGFIEYINPLCPDWDDIHYYRKVN